MAVTSRDHQKGLLGVWHCDECGKYRQIVTIDTAYFDEGYDWADNLSYNTCWRCYIKGYFRRLKSKKK